VTGGLGVTAVVAVETTAGEVGAGVTAMAAAAVGAGVTAVAVTAAARAGAGRWSPATLRGRWPR
jgi:hypothetical protein